VDWDELNNPIEYFVEKYAARLERHRLYEADAAERDAENERQYQEFLNPRVD